MVHKNLAEFLKSHGLSNLAKKAQSGGYQRLALPRLRLILDLHAVGRPDLARRVRMGELEHSTALRRSA
jgi:hypothetical protein